MTHPYTVTTECDTEGDVVLIALRHRLLAAVREFDRELRNRAKHGDAPGSWVEARELLGEVCGEILGTLEEAGEH